MLFYAFSVEGGHMDLVEYLLTNGLQIQGDKQGRTILMHAARAAHISITSLLLNSKTQYNCNVNAKDCNGENALFYASRARNMDIVKVKYIHVLLDYSRDGVLILT